MTRIRVGALYLFLNVWIACITAQCDSSICKVCDTSTCIECFDGRHGTDCGRFCSLECSGRCRQSDGYCTSGCDEGYWGPGGLCEQSCPHCNPGGCVIDTGLCIATGCQDGWWGTTCNNKCNSNCNDGCNQMNGNCNQCLPGKYGTVCQSDCSNCKDTCNITNGVCNNGCKEGLWGTSCTETCPNCQSGGCDIDYGNCNNPGCQIGWYGDNCNDKCDERCIDGCKQDTGYCNKCNKGVYGTLCDKNCNTGCLDGCNVDGSCTCKSNYYGTDCSKPCNSNCVDSLCDEVSVGFVRCTRGCVSGYREVYCDTQCPSSCSTCGRFDGNCRECSKGLYGSDCQFKCQEQCNTCYFEDGRCETCSPKYHGAGCSKRCSDKCLNGECNALHGRCNNCIPGTFGDFCESVCNTGCIGDSSTSCNRNGSCINGCVDGKYGDKCNLDCSKNCNGNCNRSNGYCNSCIYSFFGDNCNQKCGINCNGGCDRTTGNCGKCNEGYFGDNCNQKCGINCNGGCDRTTGNCGKCNEGYFGDNCNQNCSINCNGGCEKSTGSCLNCNGGFYGDNCKQQCNDKCINNECLRDGQCRFGCTNGKTGSQCDGNCNGNCTICLQTDGKICKECKPGRHGLSCDNLCNDTCYEVNSKPSCNITTGECTTGCVKGYYGNYCSQSCSRNCNNQLCNRTSGLCTDGCVAGKTGSNCLLDCNAGFYGANCLKKCGQCFNNTVCNSTTGSCGMEGCQDGFKGLMCATAEQVGADQDTIIIAVFVSVVLVLIIVVIIAVILYKRRRAKHTGEDSLSSPFSDEINKDNPVYVEEDAAIQSPQTTEYANMTDTGSIPVYQNVTIRSSTMVNLPDLWEYTQDKKAADKFSEEFGELPKDLCRPHDICLSEVNREKNRYKSICAFDETRVKLEPIDNDPNSDDINACYITKYGPSTEKNIASQGPNEVNIEEFIRMIWDVDTSKIVMLTNLVEIAVVKCLKYWPNLGKKKTFGKITIKFQKEDVFAHFTVREFRICKENCVSRTVKQYHYTSWPDKGVPSDIASLVEFRNKVSKSSSKRSGPMIVHCSAGIGRTGTFLALDYLIQQAQAENSVDICSCVSQMRQERVNMVQTVAQYIFIHDALTVWYIVGDTTSVTNYPRIYNQLLKQVEHTNISQLQHKYQLMNTISCKIDKDGYSEALKPENKNKNRDQHVLAANSKRLYLSSGSGDSTDYINAVLMPSYRKKLGYVLTQTPLSTTVNDFWEMIMNNESTIIIDIEPGAKSKDIGDYIPGEDGLNIESISISKDKIEEHESGYFDVITCIVNDTSGSEDVNRIVKIYQCRFWDTDTKTPDSSIPIFTLLDEIYQWSNTDNLGPLVVHCLNGANKSGLLCVLAAILERLTIEQDVSIIQTILQLRVSRPEIIDSFEQFQFCFEAIGEYLDTFSSYVNSC